MLQAIFCFRLSNIPLEINPFLPKSFFRFFPFDRIQYDEPVAFFRPAVKSLIEELYRRLDPQQTQLQQLLTLPGRSLCLLQKILRNFTHSKGDWLTYGDSFQIYLEGFHHLQS